jgi:hypothetical protein
MKTYHKKFAHASRRNLLHFLVVIPRAVPFAAITQVRSKFDCGPVLILHSFRIPYSGKFQAPAFSSADVIMFTLIYSSDNAKEPRIIPKYLTTNSLRINTNDDNRSECGVSGVIVRRANFICDLELPFWRQQRGSRNPRSPDSLSFCLRYSA